MKFSRIWIGNVAVILWIAAALSNPASAQVSGNASQRAKERARIVLSQVLPKLDGDHLKATLVEVNYGPGESSPPHRHSCAVVGYVVAGALRTQVRGEPEAIYKAGESFYEAANGVHIISANASQTDAARFVAYLICDNDGPLSTDVSTNTKSEGK